MTTICIDLGTSSIRAALRDGNNPPIPLSIAPEGLIDDASIPSAIMIEQQKIYLGENALRQGRLSGKEHNFFTSPKVWLFNDSISQLEEPPSVEVSFSRMELIAALTSYAAKCARKAAFKHIRNKQQVVEYRISHPVWPTLFARRAEGCYATLIQLISQGAGEDLKDIITGPELRLWCDKWLVTNQPSLPKQSPDPQEPVAAALELLDSTTLNTRDVVMLIDVGAGTTDLACFLRVIPSEDGVRQKLVQLGDPISVYAAGNQLDKALDTLATKKICDPHSLSLAKFRNDIRRNKEKLFETGTLKLGGSAGSIELAELLGTRAVKDMKTAIARGVAEIAAHAEKKLVDGHGGHPIDQVAIVFAGGGGEMEFLRTATRQAIKKTLSAKFSAQILDVPTPENYPVDASRTRMAVALGGTCQSEYWPEGRKTPPNGYKSAHLFSK